MYYIHKGNNNNIGPYSKTAEIKDKRDKRQFKIANFGLFNKGGIRTFSIIFRQLASVMRKMLHILNLQTVPNPTIYNFS